jgi:hypothetical protein
MTEAEMFRDWFNNFLTVERFASYYGISVAEAKRIISAGREQHEKEAQKKMTHDEKNVLYWLLGAARFGYLDLAQVAAWAGSDISTKHIAEVVTKLWEAQEK